MKKLLFILQAFFSSCILLINCNEKITNSIKPGIPICTLKFFLVKLLTVEFNYANLLVIIKPPNINSKLKLKKLDG